MPPAMATRVPPSPAQWLADWRAMPSAGAIACNSVTVGTSPIARPIITTMTATGTIIADTRALWLWPIITTATATGTITARPLTRAQIANRFVLLEEIEQRTERFAARRFQAPVP